MLLRIQVPPSGNLGAKVMSRPDGAGKMTIDSDLERLNIEPSRSRVLIVNSDVVSRHRMKFIASMKSLGFENIHSVVFDGLEDLKSEVMRIDPDLIVFDISHSKWEMLRSIRHIQTLPRLNEERCARGIARPLIPIDQDLSQDIMAEAINRKRFKLTTKHRF